MAALWASTHYRSAIVRVTSHVVSIVALTIAAYGATWAPASAADPDAFSYNKMLGRGMNLGDALDAPSEGAWGVTLKPEYFQAIKDAGFNSVRIPVRWSAHANSEPPYAIDPAFFERVDWAIDQALTRNLVAVLDLHHDIEMDRNPAENTVRLLALWKQISARYRDRPQTLFFELFNEPQDKFTDKIWNDILPKLLQEIRDTNPTRMVIVGPGYWNGFDHLPLLQLPENDRRLIVTFHYYKPFHFTHQAQGWLAMSQAWKGTSWGTDQDQNALRGDLETAAAWAQRHQRPLYLGEFGASEHADAADRVAWTRAVTRDAESLGFSWSYWQFCTSFGAYDTTTGTWNKALLAALMDQR
jgi:endoglucanase